MSSQKSSKFYEILMYLIIFATIVAVIAMLFYKGGRVKSSMVTEVYEITMAKSLKDAGISYSDLKCKKENGSTVCEAKNPSSKKNEKLADSLVLYNVESAIVYKEFFDSNKKIQGSGGFSVEIKNLHSDGKPMASAAADNYINKLARGMDQNQVAAQKAQINKIITENLIPMNIVFKTKYSGQDNNLTSSFDLSLDVGKSAGINTNLSFWVEPDKFIQNKGKPNNKQFEFLFPQKAKLELSLNPDSPINNLYKSTNAEDMSFSQNMDVIATYLSGAFKIRPELTNKFSSKLEGLYKGTDHSMIITMNNDENDDLLLVLGYFIKSFSMTGDLGFVLDRYKMDIK